MSTPIAPAYKPEFPLPCSSPIWKRVSAGGEASKDLLIIRRRSTTGLTGAGIGYSPVVNHEPSRIASDNTAGGEFSTDEEPEDGRPRGSTSPRVDSASRFASISKDVTSARTKASPGSVDSSTASERNRSDAENVKEEPRKLPSQRSDSPSASGNTSKNETSALETTSLDTTVSSIASADNGLLAKVGDQAARPRWYCDGCGQALPDQTRWMHCPECSGWDYCLACADNEALAHPMHNLQLTSVAQENYSRFQYPEEDNPISNNTLKLRDNTPASDVVHLIMLAEQRRPDVGQVVYTYSPFYAPGAIRLLALFPAPYNDLIRCKIVHASLDQDVSYDAISYTWGDPKSLAWIQLESYRFPVRENLEMVLRRLRLEGRLRYLWVDALCIDQLNAREKSMQIGQMKAIFEKATNVIAWLGVADESSDRAIDFVNRTGSELARRHAIADNEQSGSSPPDDGQEQLNEQTSQLSVSQDRTETPMEEYDLFSDVQSWEDFFCLVDRPWWNRAWILQEIASAKNDPILICGNRSVSWSNIERIFEECNTAASISSKDEARIFAGRVKFRLDPYIWTRIDVQEYRPVQNLSDLLSVGMKLECSDPRDKIFAFVALTDTATREALPADYTKTLVQVYTDTTRFLIEQSGKVDSLYYNTNSTNPGYKPIPLPSWVSDWTILAARPRPVWRPRLYNTAANYAAWVLPSANPAELRLRGLLMDEVAHVTPLNLFTTSSLTELRTAIAKLEEFLNSIIRSRLAAMPPADNSANTNIEDWYATLALNVDPRNSDQFWRTLIADRYFRDNKHLSSPAPDSYAELYEILRYGSDAGSRTLLADVLKDSQPIAPRLLTPSPSSCIPESFEPGRTQLEREESYVEPLVRLIKWAGEARVLFVTELGSMGLALEGCRVGDDVAVLYGSDMPVLVRPPDGEGEGKGEGEGEGRAKGCRFVSEAYVHGLMRGETFEMAEKERREGEMVFVFV